MEYIDNNKINDRLLEWTTATYIGFQYICAAISISKISVFLSLTLILTTVFLLAGKRATVYPSYLLIVMMIFMTFIISMLFLSDITASSDYLIRFILYDVCAFLIGMQRTDKDEVIKKIIIIGAIGMPFVFLTSLDPMNTSNRMGYSYSCLPILIVSFIGITYEKKYIVASMINIVIILAKFAPYAPRGVWVVIFTFFVLVTYRGIIVDKAKGSKFAISILVLLGLTVGFVYLIENLETVIAIVNDFLRSKFDIQIYALEKYLRYLAQDKLYNGRDVLWTLAMREVLKNPIIGHGIGYFESISGGSHCHNIFLQSLCEAGLLFFIPLLAYIGAIVIALVRSPFSNDSSAYKWDILTFCCGIEMLLFSSVYWLYIPFWFFLGSRIGDRRRNKFERLKNGRS